MTCLGVLAPTDVAPALTPIQVEGALRRPIRPGPDRPTLFDLIQPGETVCFVVSDHTRRTRTDVVLPFVLRGLTEKGCRLEDMFILIATGIHRPPTPSEIERILGAEVFREFQGRIFPHDPDDDRGLVEVGMTSRGHRVRVNRRAMEARHLVPIGAATYHYHAAFGGGRKSLVPGIAARDTIAHNHSLTLDPDHDQIHPAVRPGILDGNPVSEEMLEGARLCQPTCIVNTVLTPSGGLAAVFSGDLDAAHRAACQAVERVCRIDVAQRADIVLASAGSALNWIQSHKALYNAFLALAPGGRVILDAPCPEGIGDERFRHWVRKKDPGAIYRALRRSPEVLGQTALSTTEKAAQTILVTRMPPRDAEDLGIRTAPDVETALRTAANEIRENRPGGAAARGHDVTYYRMPGGRHTVPFVRDPCGGAG